MMDTVLNFVTSQPVGIFALLFLNNALMYFVAKRHFGKALVKQEDRHKVTLEWAARQEKTLRSIVCGFRDEAEGAPMPEFPNPDLGESVLECATDGCYLDESHVH